ncbi:hypothetical protein VNO77_18862 [Canavalia gladiata]|uniref:Uncharacterized protein n=1 Tax=Canavalia gladiata TaxID=3824 RepID=A0AAN9LRI9_CANGL
MNNRKGDICRLFDFLERGEAYPCEQEVGFREFRENLSGTKKGEEKGSLSMEATPQKGCFWVFHSPPNYAYFYRKECLLVDHHFLVFLSILASYFKWLSLSSVRSLACFHCASVLLYNSVNGCMSQLNMPWLNAVEKPNKVPPVVEHACIQHELPKLLEKNPDSWKHT